MRVRTSSNIDIWQHSNGHISVLRNATVTCLGLQVVLHVLVYVDVTLTRSKAKVEVEVTDHLNFRQLPINVHFHVYLLPHFRVELKTDGWYWQYRTWSTAFRRRIFEFPSSKGITRVHTSWNVDISRHSKWPHISVLGDATVTWLGRLVVLHILRMLIRPWPDARSRSRGFWTSDN